MKYPCRARRMHTGLPARDPPGRGGPRRPHPHRARGAGPAGAARLPTGVQPLPAGGHHAAQVREAGVLWKRGGGRYRVREREACSTYRGKAECGRVWTRPRSAELQPGTLCVRDAILSPQPSALNFSSPHVIMSHAGRSSRSPCTTTRPQSSTLTRTWRRWGGGGVERAFPRPGPGAGVGGQRGRSPDQGLVQAKGAWPWRVPTGQSVLQLS